MFCIKTGKGQHTHKNITMTVSVSNDFKSYKLFIKHTIQISGWKKKTEIIEYLYKIKNITTKIRHRTAAQMPPIMARLGSSERWKSVKEILLIKGWYEKWYVIICYRWIWRIKNLYLTLKYRKMPTLIAVNYRIYPINVLLIR